MDCVIQGKLAKAPTSTSSGLGQMSSFVMTESTGQDRRGERLIEVAFPADMPIAWVGSGEWREGVTNVFVRGTWQGERFMCRELGLSNSTLKPFTR